MTNKFECLNPDFKEDIEEKLTRQFFMKLMGFKLDEIELGYVRGSLEIEEKHMQQNYFVHGGVMATASDIVMGFAAYSLVPKHFGVVTTDLNMSYLNPGIGDMLIAEGRVTKYGGQLVFCEADVFVEKDGKRTRTNRATSTMFKVDLKKI
ncbi:MAG: PaaI family thioesterase [Bacteroidia bacterium]|nr:PaaI family thioesterase [Bacteroidia bacterium]